MRLVQRPYLLYNHSADRNHTPSVCPTRPFIILKRQELEVMVWSLGSIWRTQPSQKLNTEITAKKVLSLIEENIEYHDSITKLQICGYIQLGIKGVTCLISGLDQNRFRWNGKDGKDWGLTGLDLTDCGVTDRGLIKVLEYAARDARLVELDLDSNVIEVSSSGWLINFRILYLSWMFKVQKQLPSSHPTLQRHSSHKTQPFSQPQTATRSTRPVHGRPTDPYLANACPRIPTPG